MSKHLGILWYHTLESFLYPCKIVIILEYLYLNFSGKKISNKIYNFTKHVCYVSRMNIFVSELFLNTCKMVINRMKNNNRTFEPSHEIMSLFVLRKLILQTRMRSHPVGLDVLSFGRTLRLLPYFMCVNCEGSGEIARMRRDPCSSPEPSLVAYVISTIISWAGSF